MPPRASASEPIRRLPVPGVFACAAIAALFPCFLHAQALPEAPSALLFGDVAFGDAASLGQAGQQRQAGPVLPPPKPIPPCDKVNQGREPHGPGGGAPVLAAKRGMPCIQENPIQPIVSAHDLPPLTWKDKGSLAIRDQIDPFNLFTNVAYSGIAIAANSHTAYGPGFEGFGKLAGYSLLGSAEGEFFGTFAIPSLAHQDPRYYRMPGQPIGKRIIHALGHTFVTHHDNGSPMPNYATLLTYPICAELSNLYVPGVGTSSTATTKRVLLGLATDPAGSLVAEFLPDLAKRIHIRVIFVQQILQQVVDGTPNVQ